MAVQAGAASSPPMRKIVDYKIVCGARAEDVEKSIRDYIGDG
jgi:hypothetical protein